MKNDLVPDEEIVRRIINGDIDLFREVVKRYQNYIFSIGMRFFKNEDDSHDFLQEVFIKTYNNLKYYKGRAPFRFWLVKIAYNHGINKVSGRKVEGEYSDNLAVMDEKTPEKNHLKVEIKDLLLSSIEKLPFKYQVCLDLYFFLGLSYNQINLITGIPVNTIKSNVLRAKSILRDALKGTIAEEYHDL